MKKQLLSILFALPLGLMAQKTIEVTQQALAPASVLHLLEPDVNWKKDVETVESVLDLADAWTTDSVLVDKRQYLSGGWGKLGKRLNRYWEYLSPQKQKYVATCSRPYKVYDGLAKEVDMNIFLMPHLSTYIEMVRGGFNAAFQVGRSERHYRYDQPDYPCPEELRFGDLGYLTVECEGTPHVDYRDSLAAVFIPTGEGKHYLSEHGNFGVKYPSMGLYGPWVMDCNHNCRPEIHPIDWMWWLDLSEDRPGSEKAKSWMIGLVRDGSERFDTWSPSPITGAIRVPVAFPMDAPAAHIELETLVASPLDADALSEKLSGLEGEQGSANYRLKGMGNQGIDLEVRFPEPGEGLLWNLSEFQYDAQNRVVWGYLELYVSAQELYTARVTVDFEE